MSLRAVRAALAAMRAFLQFAMTMNIAEAVGLTSVLTAGFFLVRADQVSVGAVTAAALLFHRLFGPLGTLLFSFDEIQSAGAALTRLVGVADLEVPAATPGQPVPATAELIGRAVTHAYAGGDPVQLAAIPESVALRTVGVTMDPPEPSDGAIPLDDPEADPSTTAVAGTPGHFTPTGSNRPELLADMDGITASPTSAWTTGQYVLLQSGDKAHWTGTAWADGPA